MTETDASDQFCTTDFNRRYDFDIKNSKRAGGNKIRKNIDGGNVDKSRLIKLNQILLLPIPQHSMEILSKLIVNHQISEIVKVLKVGASSVLLHAKVNLLSAVYSDVESDDVILKIFTGKNHTKSDIQAAKLYNPRVYSKDRNKDKYPHKGYYYRDHLNAVDKEDLLIFRIDNVVVTKMIGIDKPAANLIQMIKQNPQNIEKYYEEIRDLINHFRARDYRFWNRKSSTKDILWHNGEWNFIDYGVENTYNQENYIKSVGNNLTSVIKAFQHYGLSIEKLQIPYTKDKCYKSSRECAIWSVVKKNLGK